MDPLSLTASIIAVLELTGKLLEYLRDVRHKSDDQAQLAVEASNIYSLLASLEVRVERSNPHDPWFEAIRNLGIEKGPLDQLGEALKQLKSKIETSHGVEKLGKHLTWKFDKSEARDILGKLERIKSLVNLALTGDIFTLSQAMNEKISTVGKGVSEINEAVMTLHNGQQAIGKGVSDISVGVATLNTGKQEEERRRIEGWLSPVDFRSRHQEILRGAQAGTRRWLFKSKKFRRWVKAGRGTLWCSGIPGAGKTVTSSMIIDYLESEHRKANVAVTCLFCNYRDRAAQSADIFMAALLKQVIQQRRNVSSELKHKYDERGNGQLKFAESAKLFSHEISHSSKVFVVIDALDETSEHEDIRRLLIPELQKLPVNLLVTSRYEKSIEQRLGNAERLEIQAMAGDVHTYVKARIPSEHLLARHTQKDPNLEETIVDKIVEKSEGMFLLARFHLDSLVTKTKPKDVRKALESLPPELDQSYEQTIERIKSQGKDYSELAMRVLLWVGCAIRPLSLIELQHAIAVQPGMTELDDDDLDEQDLMISVCAGLVVLDAETQTIRFVHYTAQEYFDRRRECLFGDAHARIAMSCITYLNFTTFADAGSSVPNKDLYEIFEYYEEESRHHPLTEYAVSTWAYHAHNTEDTHLIDTLLSFLNQNQNVVRDVRCELRVGEFTKRPGEHFSAIHIAAMYGFFVGTIFGGHTPKALVLNYLQAMAAEWFNVLAVSMLVDGVLDTNVDGMAQTPLQKGLEYLPPPLPKSPLDRHELQARRSAIVQLLSNYRSEPDSSKHKTDSTIFSVEFLTELYRQLDRGARARK